MWRKRAGVQALHDMGVLGTEPHRRLHAANTRHDYVGQFTYIPTFVMSMCQLIHAMAGSVDIRCFCIEQAFPSPRG